MSARVVCPSLLLCSACSVFGLSGEDRQRVAEFQERAALYNAANRLPQALDQVRMGLEIAPTDYKLNTMRGYYLLRQANDPRYATTPARRRGLLDDARAAFDKTLALRAFEKHSPQALLGDALLHEELARTALADLAQTEKEAARRELNAQERALYNVRRQELELESRQHLARAERDLAQLEQRGDMLLLTHKHMMNVKALAKDYGGAVEHGQKYLDRCRALQSSKQKVYENTPYVDAEMRAAQELGVLVDDELTVRAQLADLHFNHQQYQQSVKELDRILTLDPSRSADYYNRARAEYELGHYDAAFKDVQKFLATHALPSGHPTLLRAHEMLRKLDERRR